MMKRYLILLLLIAWQPSDGRPKVTISGSIFIVTKAAVNVKLGLVTVYTIDESVADSTVAYYQKLYKPEVDEYRSKINNYSMTADALLGIKDTTMLWKALLDGLTKKPFYGPFWPHVDSVRTDADGKFKLTVPSGHRYVLVADGSRVIFDEHEYYHWYVHVNPAQGREVLLSNDNMLEN
jgi:hypothetical protein